MSFVLLLFFFEIRVNMSVDQSPSSSVMADEDRGAPPSAEALELEEIQPQDASWSLSSAKPGNGIEQLLDGNHETFWQSDGTQPHTITIQFYKKTKLTDIYVQFNYKSDESYTPLQLSVRIGSGYYDLQEIQVVDLREPEGWVRIPLALPPLDGPRALFRQDSASIRDKSYGGAVDFIRTYVVQIAVMCNHQNGRDTHVRGIKLFGPREERIAQLQPVIGATGSVEKLAVGIGLLTAEMTSMTLIRYLHARVTVL
jgi:anaphase-promoting complex subunit 10